MSCEGLANCLEAGKQDMIEIPPELLKRPYVKVEELVTKDSSPVRVALQLSASLAEFRPSHTQDSQASPHCS
jgi:hypothetical protein